MRESDKQAVIEFSLVANAIDSIEHAIDLMAWESNQEDTKRFKNSILSVYHGLELLLKERLRVIHPSLIWENVDQYPSLSARTVGIEKALHRLEQIGKISLTERDISILRSLRKMRNAIEHYKWSTTRGEAEAIIGRALSLAIFFAKEHVGIELFGYAHKDDDTYDVLITSNPELIKTDEIRNQELTHMNSNNIHKLRECNFCKALTVGESSEICELCGHWTGNYREPEYDDVPF